jgi:ribosome-associated toxin RatA of RatAB toxin-antitoxin module
MIHALALTAAFALADMPAPLKDAGVTAAEWSTLEKGEVVAKTETYKTADGKDAGRGRAWIVINATPDACFATLKKYEDVPQYMPRVKKVTFLERSDAAYTVVQEIKVAFSTYRYSMKFAFDAAAKSMSWSLNKAYKNDIKDTTGRWLFLPMDGGKTLLDYTVAADTGAAVPEFLANYLTKRDLPDVLQSFKKRVESGGKWTRD